LDAISLTGPAVNHPQDGPQHPNERPDERMDGIGGPVQQPGSGPQAYQPQETRPQEWHPQESGPQPQTYRPTAPSQDYPISCGGPELIYNGNFEAGFVEVPWGDVGRGWEAFTNGGAANYGFYDEEWDVVVADGQHGQLIEINSKSVYPTDADRYAGISQRIGGLHPGATYELTLRGELRGEGNEDDPYRFAAQWGLGRDGDWQSVDEWTTMDLGPIAVRTQPLPLAQYKVRFEAPGTGTVLFIRGWKKFGITNVEMDFNLDAISLRACDQKGPDKSQGWQEPSPWAEERGQGGPVNQGPGTPDRERPAQNEGGSCLYVVKPGDALSQIAVDHGVDMEIIIRANGISDAGSIYVGQKFEIPGCTMDNRGSGPATSEPVHSQAAQSQERPAEPYEVVQGERPADAPVRYGPALRPTAEDRPAQEPDQQAGSRTYTVQGGDMLSWIAEEHGVNAYDLAAANGIDNMNFIYAGQVLVIPN
jgi:LysM repeat protein